MHLGAWSSREAEAFENSQHPQCTSNEPLFMASIHARRDDATCVGV